ncbi:MAG: efflux RND transporter periplasmic adaptor subunit [Pseudomonadota bacterium]
MDIKIFKTRNIVFVSLSILLLFIVLVVLDIDAETNYKKALEKQKIILPPVSVIYSKPGTFQANVKSFGEIKPRWQTIIKSRVSGEVKNLSDNFLEGSRVKQGEELISIESSSYRAQKAEARNQVSQAEINLRKTEREAEQARRNWNRSGLKGVPESPLVLYKPQLTAAEKQLLSAKASLEEATTLLSYTQIKAPYDSVIISRFVNPGESVDPGQTLAIVMSPSILDITLKLNDKQWDLIVNDWKDKIARIKDINKNIEWAAVLQRDGGYIDKQTRQRFLHLTLLDNKLIDSPLAGSFVHVTLPGKKIDNLLKVPESALTQDGHVWYVDEDNKLQRFDSLRMFSKKQNIFITVPKHLHKNTLSIVITPLSSYLPGMKVSAISIDGKD